MVSSVASICFHSQSRSHIYNSVCNYMQAEDKLNKIQVLKENDNKMKTDIAVSQVFERNMTGNLMPKLEICAEIYSNVE